jgi:hypothetical protein
VRLGGSVGALGVGGGICGVAMRPVAGEIAAGDGVRDRAGDASGRRPVDAPARDEERTRPSMANASTAMKRTIAA